MKQIDDSFYTRQVSRLMKDFDRVVREIQPQLILSFGEERLASMVHIARDEYRHLLPELPYVGGEQPFTQFVIASGWFLALYRVMRAQGLGVQAIGETVFQLSRTYLQRVPGFARRLLGYMSFSPRYLRNLRQRPAASQLHPYPRGYIYDYVPGDGLSFDYGVNYRQCATWTLFQEQGAPELAPYLCACDYLYSEMLGWGLKRTTTLAEGGVCCDFRFKRHGPTRISSTVLEFPH